MNGSTRWGRKAAAAGAVLGGGLIVACDTYVRSCGKRASGNPNHHGYAIKPEATATTAIATAMLFSAIAGTSAMATQFVVNVARKER